MEGSDTDEPWSLLLMYSILIYSMVFGYRIICHCSSSLIFLLWPHPERMATVLWVVRKFKLKTHINCRKPIHLYSAGPDVSTLLCSGLLQQALPSGPTGVFFRTVMLIALTLTMDVPSPMWLWSHRVKSSISETWNQYVCVLYHCRMYFT